MRELVADKRDLTESISDYTYRVLKKNIIYLNIKPGESISENTITAALNVSRTPVRETFSKLTSEYLVEVYPQKGTYVSLIDSSRLKESVFMRSTLEKAIMEKACTQFSDEYLCLVEANLNQQIFWFNKNKFDEVFNLDNKMHELIYKGCGMERIWDAIQSISGDQYRVRYLKLTKKMRWDETIQEHRQIIEAIKNKDVEKGCKSVNEHIMKMDNDVAVLMKEHPEYFKSI